MYIVHAKLWQEDYDPVEMDVVGYFVREEKEFDTVGEAIDYILDFDKYDILVKVEREDDFCNADITRKVLQSILALR